MTNCDYVELDGKKVKRTSISYKLREQEVEGEKVLCATDAFYTRNENGSLKLLYNNKPGKKAKKALKRERVKARKEIANGN